MAGFHEVNASDVGDHLQCRGVPLPNDEPVKPVTKFKAENERMTGRKASNENELMRTSF